jgi:hypothetical protein
MDICYKLKNWVRRALQLRVNLTAEQSSLQQNSEDRYFTKETVASSTLT